MPNIKAYCREPQRCSKAGESEYLDIKIKL